MSKEYDALPKPPKDKGERDGDSNEVVLSCWSQDAMKDLRPLIFSLIPDDGVKWIWKNKARGMWTNIVFREEVAKRSEMRKARYLSSAFIKMDSSPFHPIIHSFAALLTETQYRFTKHFRTMCEVVMRHLHEGTHISEQAKLTITRKLIKLIPSGNPENITRITHVICTHVNQLITAANTNELFITIKNSEVERKKIAHQIEKIFLTNKKNNSSDFINTEKTSNQRQEKIAQRIHVLEFMMGIVGLAFSVVGPLYSAFGQAGDDYFRNLSIVVSAVGALILFTLVLIEAQKRKQIFTRAGAYLQRTLFHQDPERLQQYPFSSEPRVIALSEGEESSDEAQTFLPAAQIGYQAQDIFSVTIEGIPSVFSVNSDAPPQNRK